MPPVLPTWTLFWSQLPVLSERDWRRGWEADRADAGHRQELGDGRWWQWTQSATLSHTEAGMYRSSTTSSLLFSLRSLFLHVSLPFQARGFCLLEHSTTHWKSGICPYGSTSPSPIIERTDTGSTYFRHFFYGKEHQNWFGVDEALGPVALSIRRERVVGGGEGQTGPGGGHHNHHHNHHHHYHQVEAKVGCRSTSCTGSLCAPASSYHSG